MVLTMILVRWENTFLYVRYNFGTTRLIRHVLHTIYTKWKQRDVHRVSLYFQRKTKQNDNCPAKKNMLKKKKVVEYTVLAIQYF